MEQTDTTRQEIKYYNGTGGILNFYKIGEDSVYYSNNAKKFFLKNDEVMPNYIIPAGKRLVPFYSNKKVDTVSFNWLVPVTGARICCGVEALPVGYDKYIVDKAFKAACREVGFSVDSLVVPINKVYNSQLQCVGYLELMVY